MEKTEADINKQLAKYYENSMQTVTKEFEITYKKLLDTIAEDKTPTPADLYNLDRYWRLQAQLKKEGTKLGNKTIQLLSKQFEENWSEVYKRVAVPSAAEFSTISTSKAKQAIQSIWCSDGKHFSNRVWDNTAALVQDLNAELTKSVITGKKPDELVKKLQEKYGVSYNRSKTVVRTELSHINNAAAVERYKDSGITKIEILAEDAGCDYCAEQDGQTYFVMDNPVPFHANCRCCVLPVIE